MTQAYLALTLLFSLLVPFQQPSGCWYDPAVEALLDDVTFASYSGWLRGLSGEMDVQIAGQPKRITTRYTPHLFDGSTPSAYDYVREQIAGWYPAGQIEEDPFGSGAKNLILTIPGTTSPDEVVLITAHLDSTSPEWANAPGADDNATGAAALLEAARVLRPQAGKPGGLPRSLRLIWFTGEEQGLVGSRAYTSDHDLSGIVGVFNIDMIGYDGNGDRCFELHVGTRATSQQLGQCVVNAISLYQIDLTPELITTNASTRSDHSSFWLYDIAALEVGENFFGNPEPGYCGAGDSSPYYHRPEDTYANMHPEYAYDITRATLAAAFSQASPQPAPHFVYFPLFQMLRNE